MKEIDMENLMNILNKIYEKHRSEIIFLANNKKYANIILSTNMCAGRIDEKINIIINKSETL